MRVLAAPDKFRGTLSAREAAAAIAADAARASWECNELPLADGGEGTLDVLGGGNRTTIVTGPLGEPVEAAWRSRGRRCADRGGAGVRALARRRRRGNDPLRATSRGVGELVAAAIERRSRARRRHGRRSRVDRRRRRRRRGARECRCACRWRSRATSMRVSSTQPTSSRRRRERRRSRSAILRERLAALDVPDLPGAGAAGGLAGGLAALGATLVRRLRPRRGPARASTRQLAERRASSSRAKGSSTRRRSPARSSEACSSEPLEQAIRPSSSPASS